MNKDNLIDAIRKNDYEKTVECVENGVNIDKYMVSAVFDKVGSSVFDCADKVGSSVVNEKILEYLLKNSDVDIDINYNCPINLLKIILKYRNIINKRDNYGETYLYKYFIKDIKVVEFLLNNGANVDIVNGSGETPIFYIARHCTNCFVKHNDGINIIKLMLSKSKDPKKLVNTFNGENMHLLFYIRNKKLYDVLEPYIDFNIIPNINLYHMNNPHISEFMKENKQKSFYETYCVIS